MFLYKKTKELRQIKRQDCIAIVSIYYHLWLLQDTVFSEEVPTASYCTTVLSVIAILYVFKLWITLVMLNSFVLRLLRKISDDSDASEWLLSLKLLMLPGWGLRALWAERNWGHWVCSHWEQHMDVHRSDGCFEFLAKGEETNNLESKRHPFLQNSLSPGSGATNLLVHSQSSMKQIWLIFWNQAQAFFLM